MIPDPWIGAALRRVLALLAAPWEQQIAYLRRTGPYDVDELALEFDDIAGAAEGQLENEEDEAAAAALRALRRLDDALDAISGQENAALWTDEALRDALQWAHIRNLAGTALAALGGLAPDKEPSSGEKK